jgi:hypothetical protein
MIYATVYQLDETTFSIECDDDDSKTVEFSVTQAKNLMQAAKFKGARELQKIVHDTVEVSEVKGLPNARSLDRQFDAQLEAWYARELREGWEEQILEQELPQEYDSDYEVEEHFRTLDHLSDLSQDMDPRDSDYVDDDRNWEAEINQESYDNCIMRKILTSHRGDATPKATPATREKIFGE